MKIELSQVVNNVLNNAIKFVKVVKFEIETQIKEGNRADFNNYSHPIPAYLKEKLDSIFDLFFSK
jgi:signal transduction histidine kinase